MTISGRPTSVNGVVNGNEAINDIPYGTTEIVLVRHGETTWNSIGRIQGALESPLNDVGRKQAVAIAERLANELKPTAIYSSDLKRAKDTADMIAKKCYCPKVIVVPELKERHVGSLQGLYWKEGEEKEPEAYRAFFSTQDDLEIPGGGESFNQLQERSMDAIEKIASMHKGERVIVVSHGGVLRAIYLYITKAAVAGKLLNASVNVLHFSNGDWDIKSWSDVSHLKGVGFLERGFNGDSINA
ncbi:metal-independent phosphoserine phosphatase isoform X2 [Tripterygium wilfordii]|uniref:metal-independent phosphoserine phosphatase isoform X2 n=1 Tax=Tripterygium wilfordii TaxID=458696 RepID=UPI0018F82917|nr:metal-independent phosphoserine phosphatase isoform X2 [Tripterygium wilfordii]